MLFFLAALFKSVDERRFDTFFSCWRCERMAKEQDKRRRGRRYLKDGEREILAVVNKMQYAISSN